MKALVIFLFFFPAIIFGSSLDSIIQGEKTSTDFTHSLKIIAEFSPDRVARSEPTLLTVYGRISDGFHIYSIRPQGDFAPEPTQLILDSIILIKIDTALESKVKSIIDDAFGLPLHVHQNEFWIRQKYQINQDMQKGIYKIRGYLQYQVCNNRICSLPLKVYFQEQLHITE